MELTIGRSAVVAASLALALGVGAMSGCGSSESTTQQGDRSAQSAESAQSVQSAEQEEAGQAKKDFDGSSVSGDIGEGTVTLRTAAGTSEEGNVPKITLSSSTVITQVEVDTEGIDPAAVTYIYVDGVEHDKGNHGTSQINVTLSGDDLKQGTHVIEVVQFEGDDTAAPVSAYHSVSYEIA